MIKRLCKTLIYNLILSWYVIAMYLEVEASLDANMIDVQLFFTLYF